MEIIKEAFDVYMSMGEVIITIHPISFVIILILLILLIYDDIVNRQNSKMYIEQFKSMQGEYQRATALVEEYKLIIRKQNEKRNKSNHKGTSDAEVPGTDVQ